MDIDRYAGLFARELRALRREIAAFPDDESLRALPEGVANSAGTLARHTVGNLRHFIGGRLGGSGYVRDRAAEFAHGDDGREELLALIDTGAEEVLQALAGLDPARLSADFPDPVAGHHLGTEEFLMHLLVHSGYHLGQLNYLRRIVTGSNTPVDAMAIAEIPGARRAP